MLQTNIRRTKQRQKTYAVVDLWSLTDIQNKFKDHFQNATINSTVVLMLPESDYTNYIVARPHGKTEGTPRHSKIILMEQLDTAFQFNTGEAPICNLSVFSSDAMHKVLYCNSQETEHTALQ